MKKMKKLVSAVLSFLTAAALCTGAISPVFAQEKQNEQQEQVVIQYEHYDTNRMAELLKKFEDELKKRNNDQNVRLSYIDIVVEIDYIQTHTALASVQYSEHMTEENFAEYEYMYNVSAECTQDVYKALQASLNSRYRSLMKEMLGNIYMDSSNDDLANAAELFNKRMDIQQRYKEIVYSSKTEDEKKLECAELYLEFAKLMNAAADGDYFSYAYQYVYNRTYTPEEIDSISDSVRKSMLNCYDKIYSRYTEASETASDKNFVFENNFEAVKQFSGKISEELRDSAEIVERYDLYKYSGDADSEKLAYTVSLPYYQVGIIYQYTYGNTSDFFSAVHEFGHFNAMRFCDIPYLYLRSTDLDIAEVQSQGLEVLYTNFFEEIYGSSSEKFRQMQALELVNGIAAGFMGNEFEYYVFKNADTMTAEEVSAKYDEIANKYQLYRVPFYYISHFFTNPGYYISYATSAMAVFDLWGVMETDFNKAAQMYTDFSHIAYTSGVSFKDALSTTGFDDIFSEEFAASKLEEITDLITDRRYKGDTDGNGIVNSADMVYMMKFMIDPDNVITDEVLESCDLDGDGKLTVADVVKMKNILLYDGITVHYKLKDDDEQ